MCLFPLTSIYIYYTIISSWRISFASETKTCNRQQQLLKKKTKREECNISHNPCRSQAVLCGDGVGRLADAAELLRPLSYSGCGHVAGAAGRGCSQPWWDSVWCLCLHTCTCEAEILNTSPAVRVGLLWPSGPGAELPGQVPLLPLPGWRAGGRSCAHRGGEEGEPRGAAGHSSPPLADWTWRPHEDDPEETVRIQSSNLTDVKSSGSVWRACDFIYMSPVFQPGWENSRWSGDHLWRAAAYKGLISPLHHCEYNSRALFQPLRLLLHLNTEWFS